MENSPVTIYLTESCSYCGAARMLLTKKGVRYEERVVSRDADLRDEMVERTGKTSVPQIFIGGEYVGGCTEVIEAYRDGSLQRRLDAQGVAYDKAMQADPASFLPGWLLPR